MAEMVARPTEYMYQDPPTVLVCLWCSGIFCATVTIAITVYNIRSHYHSAREQGLGHHEMLPSFGARADRIMQLLLVPLVGASTAALQMFLPGGAPILSFLRVYQFTRAMQDLVEFLFLLNGSQQHILDSLPKEKITLFSKFPLCCVFGWSCCAHRPRLGHLRFFVAGIRQFNWLMPLLGVISVYMESQNYPYDDPIETVCRTLTTVSTFFAMWAFKCLLPLMTYSITATTVDPDRIAHMERFVLLQYPAAKVLGLIVPVVIKQNLVSEQCVMPNAIYVTIVEGFMLTLFQLGMAVLGACAYTADEHLYPELDEANDFPPDAIALLDMNGVDVTRWKRLQPFHDF